MKRNNTKTFFSGKVWLIAFLCNVMILNFTHAQETSFGKPISFGGKIGPAFSNFGKNFQNQFDPKMGIAVGGFANVEFFDGISVMPELLYQQLGAVNAVQKFGTVTNWTIYGPTNYTIHNIEAPILISIAPMGYSEKIVPRIFVGNSFGYLIKASANYRVYHNTNPDIYTYRRDDVTKEFSKLDLAAVFGFGINFKSDPVVYTFDIRYRMGYKNINAVYKHDEYTNNCVNVMFGVGF